jgi:TolA-binding protein
MVDGRDLRLAHMGWERGEIVIYSLESVTLQHRLGKIRTVKATAPVNLESDKDVFGLEDQMMAMDSEQEDESGEGDVSSTLINIFSKYPLKNTHLAINAPEGQTTYYSFENDFKLKGKKLKKQLRDEIGPLAGGSVESSMLDCFKSSTGELTAVVFEGSVPLIEELLDIKTFLPGGAPNFTLVQSNELALVNLARVSLDLEQGTISALVYIGADFSRVIILRGDYPLSFVQTIREGYASPQVCQTLFSKILLEQEEAGLPEIDRIILAGEVGLTYAYEFFSRQFPDAKVQSFTPGPLNVNSLKPEEIAVFPNYAVPVALAWQALETSKPAFIPSDLVPTAIKEQQKLFKIAWHGFLLLGFVFCCMALLSYQGLTRRNDIKMLQESIRHKSESIESLQPELTILAQIQSQIGNYRANLDFLDSLIVDPGKWSRLFSKLSQNFHTVNDIWIEDIKSDPKGFTLVGKTLFRDRVPKLAYGFEGTDLKRVTRIKSDEGGLTYEFELTAEVPAPQVSGPIGDYQATGEQTDESVNTTKLSSPSDLQSLPIEGSQQADTVAKDQGIRSQSNPDQASPLDPLPPLALHADPPTPPAQVGGSPAQNPSRQTHEVDGEAISAGQPPQPASGKVVSEQYTFSTSYNKGIRFVRSGDTEGAIKAFEEVISGSSAGSEAAAAHYWIGECHFAAGEYETAIGDFSTSLALADNPKREAGTLMLGLAHLKLKQYEPARAQFERLLEEFPLSEFAPTAKTYLKNISERGK